MAKTNNLKDFLTDLYEGIASKKPNASRNPQDFRSEIESISGGGCDLVYKALSNDKKVVPVGEHIDKIYIDTSIEAGVVYNLLSQITYTDNLYFIYIAEDMSEMINIEYDSENDTYNIMTMNAGTFCVVTQTTLNSVDVLNINGVGVGELMGMLAGNQNNLVKDFIYTAEEVEQTKKLNGTYQGITLNSIEETTDAMQYIDNNEIITKVKNALVGLIDGNVAKLKSLKSNVRDYAFYGINVLKIVDLPNVENIGNSAFYNCENLKAVIIRCNSVCSLGTNAFTNSSVENGIGYIYVPRSLVESYKNATNWSALSLHVFRALEDYTIDGTISGELDESKVNA